MAVDRKKLREIFSVKQESCVDVEKAKECMRNQPKREVVDYSLSLELRFKGLGSVYNSWPYN